MNILFEYLKKNYKYDEPIFLCDIDIKGLSDNNATGEFQMIRSNFMDGISAEDYIDAASSLSMSRMVASSATMRSVCSGLR